MYNRLFGLTLAVAGILLGQLAVPARAGEPVDWASYNPEVQGATYTNSSSECIECHEEFMQKFAYSIHGRALPGGGCESCHGPMSKHMEAPRQKPALVVSMRDLTEEQSAGVCLSCHEGGKAGGPKGNIKMNWHVSSHSSAGNACIDCHNPIGVNDPVLAKATQTDVCFTCHQEQTGGKFQALAASSARGQGGLLRLP